VFDSQVHEQFVVHESEQGQVELQEGTHDFVVDVEGEFLVELVGADPGNALTHDLCLVVNALNREKGLFEALGGSAVKQELVKQKRTLLGLLLGDLKCVMLRQVREKTDKAQGVV